MEHALARLLFRWQVHGARPEAAPLLFREGWRLTLCLRAKAMAWVFLVLAIAIASGMAAIHLSSPLPPNEFVPQAVIFSVILVGAVYYLVSAYRYRVELDKQGLVISRLLRPDRTMVWPEVAALEYNANNDTLKLHARDGRKISLRLTLHGLSALRRCLAAFAPQIASQATAAADQALMANVPSWRCTVRDMQANPFAPLGPQSSGI